MLTQFELSSAQRIARVVRQVEQEPRRAKPLSFGPVLEPRGRGVLIGTFTGAWSKNTFNTVSLTNRAGSLNAVNIFATITASASARNCAIARDGTAWYLIAAEC